MHDLPNQLHQHLKIKNKKNGLSYNNNFHECTLKKKKFGISGIQIMII